MHASAQPQAPLLRRPPLAVGAAQHRQRSATIGALAALALVVAACRPAGPAAGDGGAAGAAVVFTRLDSVSVHYEPQERRFTAWSPAGATVWTVTLPNDDVLVGVPCVAPDSSVYVRGRKALYALSPAGALAWDYAAAPLDEAPSLASPAALRNSGAVLATALNTVVALAPDGAEMWRHRLTKQRTLRSAPSVGPNGFVTFATSDGLTQIGEDGLTVWERPETARAAP
ncbi:MAG: PQQ-binding-like beta-propeller repeat protein [Myxococcaceae bacterium]|jgi:outer membrane protein assembly factor BamB|nr:PQQ-binding-like beta-propeller repeat protein [Myxococcaceae bacterium]